MHSPNKLFLSLALFLPLILCRVDTNSHFDDIDDDSQDLELDESNQSKDFDFEDKKSKSSKSSLNEEMRQMYNWWTIEDICKDVKCRGWEYCVIKSKGVAVCEPKKGSDRKAEEDKASDVKTKAKAESSALDDDEDDDDYDDEDVDLKSTFAKADENKLKLCNPCPVVKPQFICGSDNATYSSICRLDFHNCVHKSDVSLECTGFCPCLKRPEPSKKKTSEKKFSKNRKNGKYFENREKFLNKFREEKKSLNKLLSNPSAYSSGGTGVADKRVKSKSVYKTNTKSKKSDPKQQIMQNSVLPNKWYEPSKPEQHSSSRCTAEDLKSMGSRLLDWFTVVIAEQKKERSQARKHWASKIPDCQPSVSYMFFHFDANSDLKLSLSELYYLEHDQNEHCLQPYLRQCDEDNDNSLSAYEWCTCFDKKSQPCLNALKHTKKGLLGAYSPQCDSQGFYKSMQCHSSTGICWCVDKNGVEFTNTRRKGFPDCKGLLNRARHRATTDDPLVREDIDIDDDGDDDDDTDGSGDDRISG